VEKAEREFDVLEQDELDRDRVRVLLDRWGVLFRQLLEREGGLLRWGKVFRTLRVMELSGEVVSGQFFEGINGLQFASPHAVEVLRNSANCDKVVWFCAADPVSVCGLGIDGLGELPRRVSGNHIGLKGDKIAVVSEGKGKRITINLAVDDPDLPKCLGFLGNMIERQVDAIKCVTVELINGVAASSSEFRGVFESMFECVGDRGRLKLMRRYGGAST